MEEGILPMQQMSQMQHMRAGLDVKADKHLNEAEDVDREDDADDIALVEQMSRPYTTTLKT